MYKCDNCGGNSQPREKLNRVFSYRFARVAESEKTVKQIAGEEKYCINCFIKHQEEEAKKQK